MASSENQYQSSGLKKINRSPDEEYFKPDKDQLDYQYWISAPPQVLNEVNLIEDPPTLIQAVYIKLSDLLKKLFIR